MQTLNQTVVAGGNVFARGTARKDAPGVPDGAWWDGEPEAQQDDGPFDPVEHNQGQVIEYLEREDVTDEERARVLTAEGSRESGARQKVAKWVEAREAAKQDDENAGGDADGS